MKSYESPACSTSFIRNHQKWHINCLLNDEGTSYLLSAVPPKKSIDFKEAVEAAGRENKIFLLDFFNPK